MKALNIYIAGHENDPKRPHGIIGMAIFDPPLFSGSDLNHFTRDIGRVI